MDRIEQLPIAIVGAGPIGLAAAAHLAERGVSFRVYEAGARIGANVLDWGHVRVFTTWEQCVDTASRRLLERHGWVLPPVSDFPTGGELYQEYLKPLAELPEIAEQVETGAKVQSISRSGIDKVTSKGREGRPFELAIAGAGDSQRIVLARAVIDASGTWHNPNPLGGSGLQARGEKELQSRIAYGMPDVLGKQRARYIGKRVAVVGAGYSAINVILDLTELGETTGTPDIAWIVRGKNMAKIYGGGESDQLAARGKLGSHLKSLVDRGKVKLVIGFSTQGIAASPDGITLNGLTDAGTASLGPVDEVIVSTGQRPDLDMTRELRVELDPWLESTKALGPLIDPNIHSCGSVPPHGHRETGHPEPGFYTIGVKSYGRAPTFLLLTGYEQARSVAAALAGDMRAADDVRLALPETGICQTDFEAAGSDCCGGPAPEKADACCMADAVAKDAGKKRCGCGVAV